MRRLLTIHPEPEPGGIRADDGGPLPHIQPAWWPGLWWRVGYCGVCYAWVWLKMDGMGITAASEIEGCVHAEQQWSEIRDHWRFERDEAHESDLLRADEPERIDAAGGAGYAAAGG